MLRSETAGDWQRTEQALAGLRKYQEAPRAPAEPPPPALTGGYGASLRDYGGSGRPVLFIPSLINPPNILDLGPDRSLLRWLAEKGHRPLLLDWGWDVQSRRILSVAGHVEEIALPLIAGLGEPPALVGYCLGGTMALAAAALTQVERIATIAAPWHFSGFPDEARNSLAQIWADAAPTVKSLGLLPMEALQRAFWGLDPQRTIDKFVAFAAMEPDSEAARTFVTLEDWANDGPPLSEAAARETFESFFGDDLPGSEGWQVGGQIIDPSALEVPLLNIVSTTDRIVPRESAIQAGERIDLALGHVGMVVGSRAREALWEPLSAWLSRSPPS
jgi:polyhydroxyalkanoate synthase